MNSALDYEKIAHLYDSYCRFTNDLPFFIQECRKTNGSVLELMCGTGRISIPLLQAGVKLTCVDASPAMLAILRQKLEEHQLSASVLQANIADLNLPSAFDLVLLPFQSFHELQSETAQRQALTAIARSLKPSGRFICTLHNPKVRLQPAQQDVKQYGPFPRVDGDGAVSVTVDLSYDAASGTVSGLQTIYELDAANQKVAEHPLTVQFSLIELGTFQDLIQAVNFNLETIYGNYDFSPFVPETSPYMIMCMRKPDQSPIRMMRF